MGNLHEGGLQRGTHDVGEEQLEQKTKVWNKSGFFSESRWGSDWVSWWQLVVRRPGSGSGCFVT